MLAAAAFCPHPPILMPVAAGTRSAELDPVRTACWQAVARLVAVRPDVLWVIGAGPDTTAHPPGSAGSLRGFGVDARSALGADGGGAPELPLSLTVGAWLTQELSLKVRGQSIAADEDRAECERLGTALAGLHERVALLVMGDGPASPGDYDERLAGVLGGADLDGVTGLPAPDAAEPGLSGWAPWQVAAGAARAAVRARRTVHGELLAHAAPYGVGYVVAVWTVEEAAR